MFTTVGCEVLCPVVAECSVGCIYDIACIVSRSFIERPLISICTHCQLHIARLSIVPLLSPCQIIVTSQAAILRWILCCLQPSKDLLIAWPLPTRLLEALGALRKTVTAGRWLTLASAALMSLACFSEKYLDL